MAGYWGTQKQKDLQARAEQAMAWCRETPGACNPGRLRGTDDPDRLGWDAIFEILDEDGVCGFRMIDAEAMKTAAERVAERGYRLDNWDVFFARREEAEPACLAIMDEVLADGYTEIELAADDKAAIGAFQDLVGEAGIAPFSASMLAGEFGPVTTVAILTPDGAMAAAAHGYLPHNEHSGHHASAWGGLVAVAPAHRGKRLGRRINARLVANCFSTLGAESVYELVSTTNTTSRRMVESCGLRHEPAFLCGIAVADADRFTR